ncbi:MAG: chorismate synthase [Candidatus Thorarchaeota archaeon]|nr:chorismate synthase [Candidatus Thorarchaeota archaeon]
MFTFGKLFKIHVFGESHGKSIGVVVEGCPTGISLDPEVIQEALDQRRPGTGRLTTARQEPDQVKILSGIFKGHSTGGPILLLIHNEDCDSSGYDDLHDTPRPGHADYTARIKYGGNNDYRGGGFFSGRITASFVMAGAVANQILKSYGIEILAHTTKIGRVKVDEPISNEQIREQVYRNETRCADAIIARQMEQEVLAAKSARDSVGGIIECRVLNLPAGLGEPIFDSVESYLSHAMFSIPAVKGIEFGAGFSAAEMRGSTHNDQMRIHDGEVSFLKNDAGGILGGITTGAPVVFRVAVKPTPSIAVPQQTVNLATGENAEIKIIGRHDPCIVPRAVPVVEAMAAIVFADLLAYAKVSNVRGIPRPLTDHTIFTES